MVKPLAIIGSALVLGGVMYGATLGATDCTKVTLDSTFKVKTKTEKMTQLETKIWQDIKRNEIPELDLAVVSVEEYSQAYANLANQKNAKQKDNLFEGLRDEAVKEGATCI